MKKEVRKKDRKKDRKRERKKEGMDGEGEEIRMGGEEEG